jgi:hypothetical protein
MFYFAAGFITFFRPQGSLIFFDKEQKTKKHGRLESQKTTHTHEKLA